MGNHLTDNKTPSNRELDILDILNKIFEVTVKYKIIIISSFIILTVVGGIYGLKIDRANRYYIQNVKFNQLNSKTGINLDGTKFTEDFLIEGNNELIVTPKIPEEIKTFLLNRLRAGVEEKHIATEYIIATKRGFYTEESKNALNETINRNVVLYTERQIPQKKFQKIDVAGLRDLQYNDREDFLLTKLREREVSIEEVKQIKQIKNVLSKEERIIIANLLENLQNDIINYGENIKENKYVFNLEAFRKVYEKKIKEEELKISENKETIKKLEKLIELPTNKEIPLTALIGGKKYGDILNELGMLILTVPKQEINLNIIKNYYKNSKEIKKDEVELLWKQEDEILEKLDLLTNKLNPMLQEENKVKRGELVTIGTPTFIRERSWKKYLIIGAILGIILGYSVALGMVILEILKKDKLKKEDKAKN